MYNAKIALRTALLCAVLGSIAVIDILEPIFINLASLLLGCTLSPAAQLCCAC